MTLDSSAPPSTNGTATQPPALHPMPEAPPATVQPTPHPARLRPTPSPRPTPAPQQPPATHAAPPTVPVADRADGTDPADGTGDAVHGVPSRGRVRFGPTRWWYRLAALASLLVVGGAAVGFTGAMMLTPVYAAGGDVLYSLTREQPTGFLREDRNLSTQLVVLRAERFSTGWPPTTGSRSTTSPRR